MKRAQEGFLNQADVDLVQDGLATPILLLDGLNEAFPDNDGLLFSACQLNTAYGSLLLFKDSENNKKRASMAFTKAKTYIFKDLELRNKKFKKVKDAPYEEFITCLPKFKKKDVPNLYYAAQAWTMWIICEDTWESKADVPKVEAILNRILELDDTYNYGMTHCLIGAIYTTRPAELGGQPEEAKKHFEKALEISEGKNLLIHVFYARQYCKLVYDRELHDKLLQQVIDADVSKLPKDLTMMNVLAKEQAQDLLDSADEYF
jgi:tetratricopeptide (TPR) repeat protein